MRPEPQYVPGAEVYFVEPYTRTDGSQSDGHMIVHLPGGGYTRCFWCTAGQNGDACWASKAVEARKEER